MKFFISAELASLDASVNAMRSKDLKALLKRHGLNPRPAIGRYKGIDETSYLIESSPEDSARAYQVITELASTYEQESILILNGGSGMVQRPNGEVLASLTLVQESLESERPEADHTAVKIGDRWLVLRLA